MVFLILYVDDILLIGNDVKTLTSVRHWLAEQFDMKDLGEANYVLGIQILQDMKNKRIALSQTSYINSGEIFNTKFQERSITFQT